MTLEKYNFKITPIKARANNYGATKPLCREELHLAEQEEVYEKNNFIHKSSKDIHSSKDATKNFPIFHNFSHGKKDNKIGDFKEKVKERNVFYNPKVLIEKLPEHVVKKALMNEESINAKSIKHKTGENSTANRCVRFCENCKKIRVNCNFKMKTCCPKCKKPLVFECKKCKKHIRSYTGFLYHLRTTCQSEGHYYQCAGCPYKSAFKVRIKEHMQKLHKDLPVSDMRIIATEDLQKDRKNSEIHVHKCCKCGQRFRELHFLNNHLKVCRNFKDRVVFTGENEVCNKNKESNIDDQSNQSVPIPDTLYVINMAVLYCQKCDKKIAMGDSVYGPQKCNDCKSDLLFECTKCEKQYKCGKSIVYHFKANCAVQEMYYCSKCNYQNPIKTLVFRHYKKVHEPNFVECPKCKNVLKNKETLMKHLEYCGKKANLRCDMCSYKTHNHNQLKTHIKRHELNDNKIEANCPKCKKKLKNRFSLRCHLQYCGKEPWYHCTMCAYKSQFKKTLRGHMIRMHFKDENNYPACPKCGAKFGYKKCANAHLRFCGTSKPHVQCDYCPFKCGTKDEIKSHISRLHLRNIDDFDDSDIDVVN